MKDVRVRFAPSPTGPLHIGGVRTALYNYLFAKKHEGTFILRIEDTDQERYVAGAEAYILEALKWLNIDPEEGLQRGGEDGPYRQSERREIYQAQIQKLIANGSAYFAFDTPEELAAMRERKTTEGIHSPKYDHSVRMEMSNSITKSKEFVDQWLADGKPYAVRLKIEVDQTIVFQDGIRGEVSFSSNELDDKVLMKADGLPTYHFANIVDDHDMRITHVIRGEEWLSSTPHHVLLYRAFGWQDVMPTFVHLPLILKPTGKGKLAKRDGAKFGFPVFPMNWDAGEETFMGFREEGFLPESVINFLALLGWHPEDDQEIFNMNELIEAFSIDRIAKSGARFDYDKAKWFNQQYIKAATNSDLLTWLKENDLSFPFEDDLALRIIEEMKPRVESLKELRTESTFFWERPSQYDEKTIGKKWNPEIAKSYSFLAASLGELGQWTKDEIETEVKTFIANQELKFGQIFPLLRIGVSGTTQGPDLFTMMAILGQVETVERLNLGAQKFDVIS